MPDGQSLEFSGVTKRFGSITAVAEFTARVEPGVVTGFLGPNGAGKTTTLRILLGLVRATGGTATIGGVPYARLERPLQTVGAVLEASSFHPGRTAAAHLTVYAQAAGIGKSRVDETLGLVGLADAAGRKVGGFSLGMRQRLGLAYALLGDPGVLVLDEPANGLDPEGIRWMRGFLQQLAREGRTVLVSSHMLAEVQQTVDALLIISRGRLVFQGSIDDLSDPSEHATVVDSPDRAALAAALQGAGVTFEVLRSGLTVRGVDTAEVGAVAASAGVALSSLHRRGPALEEVFLDLVNGARVHPSATGAASPGGPLAVGAMAPVLGAATETTEASSGTGPSPAAGAEPASESGAEPASESGAEPASESGAEADPKAALEADAEEEVPDQDPAADDETAEEAPFRLPGADTLAAAAAGARAPWADEVFGRRDDTHVGDRGSAGFAVASTGVIDIVPSGGGNEANVDELPEDADPDVEAIGEIDDELSAVEPAESDDARPWESHVKTEADVEADRFFGAFDAGDVGDTGDTDADPDQASKDARSEPEPGSDAPPEPESDARDDQEGEKR